MGGAPGGSMAAVQYSRWPRANTGLQQTLPLTVRSDICGGCKPPPHAHQGLLHTTLRGGGSDLCSPLNLQSHVSRGHGWGSGLRGGACLPEPLERHQEQTPCARPCSGHPWFPPIMSHCPRMPSFLQMRNVNMLAVPSQTHGARRLGSGFAPRRQLRAHSPSHWAASCPVSVPRASWELSYECHAAVCQAKGLARVAWETQVLPGKPWEADCPPPTLLGALPSAL